MNMKVVLMYHDIVTHDDTSSGFQNHSAFQYKVEAGKFENQVKALASRDDVVFTFDDGGVSFLAIAAPILEKYGKRGVFFISTQYLNTAGFLTNRQVKELEERGHTIGSHSHSHPKNFAALSSAEMDIEWCNSCSILCDILGHDVKSASIPNGYGSKELNASALRSGILDLYTSVPTTKVRQKDGQNVVGRYVVHRDMTVEDVVRLATDPRHQRAMYLRWYVLEQVKKVLGNRYESVKAMFVRNK